VSFSGNSNYLALAATAIEQSVQKDWSKVWTAGHPLITIIQDNKANFNRGFTINGTKMLLAVMGDDQTNPVEGVATGSGEVSAMTPNTGNGLSQFSYNFAHYRGNYTIRESEAVLAKNNARGNLLEGKKDQLIGSWLNKLSTHLSSTTADASDNSRVLGVYQPLSTSNTVGGISQTTDTQIAAYVKSSAGAFALELIDDCYDSINALINGQRSAKPDVILASYAASNNVYGKMRSAIAPAERLVNAEFKAKYGLENFMYLGMATVQDNRIGTTLNGSLGVLSSKTWYAYIDKMPKAHKEQRLQGTDTYEYFYTAWAGLGCNDPGLNGLIRDIT